MRLTSLLAVRPSALLMESEEHQTAMLRFSPIRLPPEQILSEVELMYQDKVQVAIYKHLWLRVMLYQFLKEVM